MSLKGPWEMESSSLHRKLLNLSCIQTSVSQGDQTAPSNCARASLSGSHGVPSKWDLPRTMSSVLCVVLRGGITGQVREQSAYGHPSSPPHRETPGLSLLRAIASLGYDHYYRNSALFSAHTYPHTWLLIKISTIFREDIYYSHL